MAEPLSPEILQFTTPQTRRAKFTPAEDLVIVREVAAVKAHVACRGEVRTRFETAAECANKSEILTAPVTWKGLQDRYLKVQALFDKRDVSMRVKSGVEEDMTEMDELLSAMKEERDDNTRAKEELKLTARNKKEKEDELGALVRERAMRRRAGADDDSSDEKTGEEEDDNPAPRKIGRRVTRGDARDARVSAATAIAKSLRDGDLARLKYEEERLAFEREKLRLQLEERKEEREDQRRERELERKEREAARKLDSETRLMEFRMMMEMIKKAPDSQK